MAKNESQPASESTEKPAAEGAPAQPTATGQQAITVSDETVEAHYANFCRVMSTPEELVLDLGLNPQPYATGSNVLLMEYIGDRYRPAPPLYSVSLEPNEAKRLLREMIANIELMIGHNMIHGDLSAYNILYWEGSIALIDFPQATDIANNPHAQAILQRDITRLCQYFAQQGDHRNPAAIADDLWRRYAPPDGVPSSEF